MKTKDYNNAADKLDQFVTEAMRHRCNVNVEQLVCLKIKLKNATPNKHDILGVNGYYNPGISGIVTSKGRKVRVSILESDPNYEKVKEEMLANFHRNISRIASQLPDFIKIPPEDKREHHDPRI